MQRPSSNAPDMEYLELQCVLDPPEPWRDILIARLAESGFDGFEETPDGFRAWIRLDRYSQENTDQALQPKEAQGKLKITSSLQSLEERNWNQEWESHFPAVWITPQCHVRAPFHPEETRARYRLVIEPKMSFGTGHHETTALMAEFVLDLPLENRHVLDMGCGTGILAIMSAMRGARPVTAIDNYAYAWENTRENALRNGFDDMEVLHGDAALLAGRHFDVILANINRNVLLADMRAYRQALRPGGTMVLSGFLSADRILVMEAAQKHGMQFREEKTRKDWVACRFDAPI